MGLFDRLRTKPLPPGPRVADVELEARAFINTQLEEVSGEIDYRDRKRMIERLRRRLDEALPKTMYAIREEFRGPSSYSHRHEDWVKKENAKLAKEGRAQLAAFVAANPDLGLISREELDSHDGSAIISWAAEHLGLDAGDDFAVRDLPASELEALKERILHEGMRWEEVVEDELAEGYSLTREYALRGAGVVNLGISRTPAFPSQEGDVLRTVAFTRLRHRLEPVLEQRIAMHNQSLEARPAIESLTSATAAEPAQALDHDLGR